MYVCLLLYYGMIFLSLDTIDVAIQPSMQNIIAVQGGIIVLKEVNNHWSDNLIPSPSKNDLVFQHIKGVGTHSYVQQPNGGKKYICSAQAKCKSHQRHFMKNTTTALYKHFLQQYPLRRGVYQLCALFCGYDLF